MEQRAIARPAAGQDRQSTCPACGFALPTTKPGATVAVECPGCGLPITPGQSVARPTVRTAAPAPVAKQKPNPAQVAAIETDGNCLVTACPGSGKTFVLRERIIRKLRNNPRERAIAVTFTRDAANELESRVLSAFPDAATRLLCGTFHSLCKRQLEEAGYQVNLVTEVQQMDLLRRAWTDIMQGAPGISFDQARIFVESVKAAGGHNVGDPSKDVLAAIYFRYQELLKQLDAMDFADMLVEVTKGMVSGRVQPLPGTFMVVDEGQDTDPIQFLWLWAYLDKHVEISMVGDDDQSVYSWRWGQGFDGLERFRERARASHISLDTTYRCANEVLAPAGRLIEHNKARIPKALRTENLDRGRVLRVVGTSREDEVEKLVEAVLSSGRPGDWGILARTNKIIDRIETLIAGRFPVSRRGGKSFWDMRWPSTYLGLCRSIAMDDLVGVDSVLLAAGVGERRLADLHRQFQSRSRGSLSKLLAAGHGGGDPEGVFCSRAREWRALLAKGKQELVVAGVGEYMKSHLHLAPPGARNRDEIIASAHRMIDAGVKVVRGMRGSLGNRLASLQREKTDDGDEVDASAAKLMTLHGSKGLEFDHVWMVGCEEGVIPAKGAPEDEERRLFYVGMTRARRYLYLSHADAPSPFFRECGRLD